MGEKENTITPTDLRGILNYVPRFLGQTFVVALDGVIVEHDNLPNILLDIAVLRSLQINVVIVHGIGTQIRRLAEERNVAISASDGSGPTDAATLDLAIRTSARVSHQILEGLTQSGLKCAITNSIRSKPIGVIKGQDFEYSGQVDQVDGDFLTHLIEQNIIPIIQPIGFDRNGHSLRINSDLLAVEVANSLEATKVLYLTNEPGFAFSNELERQIPVEKLEQILSSNELSDLSPSMRSKAAAALQALKKNVSRIHILDGSIHDGLIQEVFSNEGVGTLIYGNEYQQIRRAERDDVPLIYHLTRSGVKKDELLQRDIDFIEEQINDYFVYEIDGNLIACVLVSQFEEDIELREINSLFVHPLYQKQGIGQKLVNFACHQSQQDGAKRVIAFSTQSFSFFKNVCGFNESDSTNLPESRKAKWLSSLRKSKILDRRL